MSQFQSALKQVVIPPDLPALLKQFTKDAIRTQPADMLEWASRYFTAMVQGEALPTAEQMERPLSPNSTDLSPEILTAMHEQLHQQGLVSKKEVAQVWQSFGLAEDLLKHILAVGCFGEELDWIKFFALGCSYLGGTIKNAMTHALYILNADSACQPPDACVPLATFRFLYLYLAAVDGEVAQAQIDRALTYLETQAKASNGMVKISDFMNARKVRLG
ncbi:ropporin-1-like [Aplochiton taeniatus]